jgi:formylglycine-generating enzyme required for sulfatase activity
VPPFSPESLAQLTNNLADRAGGASGPRLQELIRGTETRDALSRAFEAAVVALVAEVVASVPGQSVGLLSALEQVLADPGIGPELGSLLKGNPLSREDFAFLIERAVAPADIPDEFDIDRTLTGFEAAFRAAAAREVTLVPIVTMKPVLDSASTAGSIVDSVLEFLSQAKPGSVGILGDHISAENVVNGVQFNLQLADQENRPNDKGATLREAYLSHLFQSVRHLSLTGIDPEAAKDIKTKLNLDAVYTALLTQTPEVKNEPRLEPQTDPDQKLELLSALAQLDRHSRLVLLGDPGSGKSSLLSFVSLCLVGEALGHPVANIALLTEPTVREWMAHEEPQRQPWNHGALLPVRVVLRDFAAQGLPATGERATAEHLWRFMASELEGAALGDYAPLLREELLTVGGLVLLDGLDEVPEADQRREQIRDAVEGFARTFFRCRLVVTSRRFAYEEQGWRLQGFEEAVLAPFSMAQISAFIDRWYNHVAELRLNINDARGRAALLKDAIISRDRLHALAERPLLLTLMASLHAWRGGSLPEKREQLYADTVGLLLDSWESQRVIRNPDGSPRVIQPSLAEYLRVDRDRMLDLLNELAFQAHYRQPDVVGTADISQQELVLGLVGLSEETVDWRLLEEYLSERAGLLVPHGVGVYTFPHRTFQEYLAACYLTDHDYPDKVAELARQDLERWREVALLAAAKAARGSGSTLWLLIESLCYREPTDEYAPEDVRGALVAGEALTESTNLTRVAAHHEEKVARVKRWQLHIVRSSHLTALERISAGTVLGQIGDPRAALDSLEFCYVPPGPFFLGGNVTREVHYAQRYISHECDIPYGFWLSRHRVTVEQFEAFVADGGFRESRYWAEAEHYGAWREGRVLFSENRLLPEGVFDSEHRLIAADKVEWRDWQSHDFAHPQPNFPASHITWYEALAFTRWLTERLLASGHLKEGWACQLASEIEWEKAARGGHVVPETPIIAKLGQAELGPCLPEVRLRENAAPRRIYPWGDEVDFERTMSSHLAPTNHCAVGCFSGGASPYGVEDLLGTNYEWTRTVWGFPFFFDYSERYPSSEEPMFDAPYKADDGREDLMAPPASSRVGRGSLIWADINEIEVSLSFPNPPVYHFLCGFRVAIKQV